MSPRDPESDFDWYPAPAKLNLFLHVTGRRGDGYHDLQTLFQFIDLQDRLGFALSDGDIEVENDARDIDPTRDLVRQAALRIRSEGNSAQGCRIRVEKRIPVGGGLGGGSSDAATTLVVLNRLWSLGLSSDRLAGLAASLGADVPVFVRGIAAIAEGIGERLTPVEINEPWYVVIHPDCSASTATVFAEPGLTRNTPPIRIGAAFEAASAARFGNDCEQVVRRLYPPVDAALAWLSQRAEAHLSGTGSCVFAMFDTRSEAERVVATMPDDWSAFVVRGMNRSPLLDAIGKSS